MPTLLHIDTSASPIHNSITRQLTDLYASTWRARHGNTGYRHRDLAADPVPPITGAFCALGQRSENLGTLPIADIPTIAETDAEQGEWSATTPLLDELHAADTVLIGAPMYNFGVPGALKTWIDRVTFPGAHVKPGTREPLLAHTRFVTVIARGGDYRPGSPRAGCDFLQPYLSAYLTQHLRATPTNLTFVTADHVLARFVPHLAHLIPQAEASLAAARDTLTDLARG